MIKDIVKIHDKFSVEIKLIYGTSLKKRVPKYDVLTYLFIPEGLNINRQTYTKDKFYNDVKVNIRYNTPNYSLYDFIKKNGLIDKLEKLLFDNNKGVQTVDTLITQTKLFGSIFSSAIRLDIRNVRKKISKNSIKDLKAIDELIGQIIDRYRGLIMRHESELCNKDKKLLLLADEFLSNAVEHNYVMLYDYFIRKKYKLNKEIYKIIVGRVEKEHNYRKEKKYKTVPKKNSTNEVLLYFRSQLKKYIDSILFLKKEVRREGAVFEQTIFALVAGLAMLFSTTVAFYYQQKYGNFTFPFFIALVISYMFKDRIKSLVGYFFLHKAHSFFYDYKINIYANEKTKVGIIKENFTFIPYVSLSKTIRNFRLKERFIADEIQELAEHVIQYKKRVKIYKKKFRKGIDDENITSLADITRINFHRIVLQMDNPKKTHAVIENNRIVKKIGDRVYHINIIQKFYSEEGANFKMYRVVISRDGIKRIERIDLENG